MPHPALPPRFTTRLGDRVRMTTMGEFCGWNTAPDAAADAYFRAAAKERMPGLADVIDRTETVCGLRPYSNDGIGKFSLYLIDIDTRLHSHLLA